MSPTSYRTAPPREVMGNERPAECQCTIPDNGTFDIEEPGKLSGSPA
jgi:hypothetical protein